MSNRKEMKFELGFVPRPHQVDAHKNRKRFSVYVWHRRAGKSWFSFMELILSCMRTANGRFAYVAPLKNQAKLIAWDPLKLLLKPVEDFLKFNEQELTIVFPNGAKLFVVGADKPDALRGGGFDGVVLDEVAQMKPDLWKEVIRPALADRKGWAIFIGTPKGINTFSEVYYRALANPKWHADVRRVSETNALDEEEIESVREELGDDPDAWAREMECDFSAGTKNALLSLDQVRSAQERTVGEHEFRQHPLVMGMDVARYGDDRSCVFMRQGPIAFQPKLFNGLDLMTLADNFAREINEKKPDAVFLDQGGLGSGVLDRLRQLGHVVIGIDFGGKPLVDKFDNRRAEMWWNMAAWVKSGVSIPGGQDIASDLTAPTFTYANKRGKLALESKDAMKKRGVKSPDIGDALALTFAAPVQMKNDAERASRHNPQQSAGSDYDPFAREYH